MPIRAGNLPSKENITVTVKRSLLTSVVFLFLFVFSLAPVAAQEVDQNTSPVTGRLPDSMNLTIDGPQDHPDWGPAGPAYLEPWTVRFCDPSRPYCPTPDRKLRMRGKRQKTGITITPAIEGEWRWSSDYTLTFRPKKPWPSAEHYNVTFDRNLYSPEITIQNPQISFTVKPIKAHLDSMVYFQDPNDIDKKGVTAEISFNTPVEEKSIKEHLEIVLEELTDESSPAKRTVVAAAQNMPFDFHLNPSKTRATVSIAIKSLPAKERFLKAIIKPGIVATSGGQPLQPGKPGELEERVLLPSVTSYAKIESVQAHIVKNQQFEPEQVLAVETNVPMSLEELKKQLTIKLLPKDKPASAANELPNKDYRWTSAAEVTDDILKSAAAVEFTLNPVEGDRSTLYSAKFKSEPGRWMYVRISHGLKCRGGYILGQDYNTTVQVPDYGKEARLLSEGALLALSGEKKVSVYALGVEKLEFDVGRVLLSDVNHLISQTSGSFSTPSFDNYNFGEDNIVRREKEEQTLAPAPPNKPQFTVFDFSKYLTAEPDGRGLFFLNIHGKKKNEKGIEENLASDKRFILITDVGFYVKSARDGTSELFAQSVRTGEPVANATVEVLGLNGVPVFTAETDSGGHASIPNLQGLEREKAPVAYVVRAGDDLSFMPYRRSDRKLNYSRFDTGGTEAVEDGLRGYMFSDRGIYRPGDQVNVGMIVKQGDWGHSLEGLPLFVTVDNPRGQQIEKKLVKLTSLGFIDYSFRTKDTSPTGSYTVAVSLSQNDVATTQLASTNVRIEEFLPDTMKITSAFNKGTPKGWVIPENLKAEVTLMHLYGAPAIEHRIHGNLNVNPGSFSFGGEYEDFSFFDPKQTEHSHDQDLGDLTTDDQGNAVFDINLSSFGDSTYRLTFYAEGFAPGSGRSVRTGRTVLVSSLPYVIGVKGEGNLSYINKDTERAVQFVAVDPDLKEIALQGVTAELSKITYISTLVKNEDGAYNYRSIPQESKVSSKPLPIPAAGLRYRLDTKTPGDYVLTLVNEKGLKRSRVQYTVVGVANLLGHERKEATISVKLSKPKYEPGETVELSVVSPYTGAGLITIETEKVLSHEWFRTDTESSVQRIKIPADFTGKGYINVQFVRNLTSRQVFTDPFAYTVVPIFVSTDPRDSKIQLTVPELVQPGDVLSMKYRTKEAGKIVVFAVDEGILQYARYTTPDPLSAMLNNRALQVATHQIFDLLLPEFSLLQQMAATGGDAALADGKNLNPFKRKTLPPVAFWSGIVEADDKEHEVLYNVPDYFNGTIRVMAVAVTGASLGATETKVPVRGDLIVSPNAATFVAPADEFEVPVQVANNIANSGPQAEITLTAEPSEHLEILSGAESKLTIAEGKETTVTVRLRAKDQPGGASINFRARAGKSEAKYEATLSVRPPVPSMTVLVSGYVEKGEKTVPQARALYKEFSELSATASTLPTSLVPGLEEYLLKYPYGCTEQLVSQAFPSVVLYGEKELERQDKRIFDTLSSVLTQIRERQRSDGGLGTWWSGQDTSQFITVYALHFLILAREKHLPVPNDLIERLSQYTRNMVNQSVQSLWEARQHAYGIYVLTRSGMVTSNYIPYVVKYLEENYKDTWTNDLAAVYIAATYKLLQLVPEGNALMKEFVLGDPVYWRAHPRWEEDSEDVFYNSLIRYSMYLTIMSDHFPEMLKDFDRNVLFRVANFIGEGNYNTTSSSYAILGLTSYAKASTKQVQGTVSIFQREDGGTFTPAQLVGELLKKAALSPSVRELKFSGGGNIGLFYQLSTTGFDKVLPKDVVEQGLEIKRTFLDAQGAPVKEVKLGEPLDVVITMQVHGNEELKNMVLVDLLPGGFEVVPDSVKAPASVSSSDESSSEEGEGESSEEGDSGSSEGTEGQAASETTEAAEDEGIRWTPQATDVREDRMLAFGAIPTDTVVFRYKIRAVNAGSYVVPPAYAESMYNLKVKARGVPDRMSVLPEAEKK